MQVSERTIMILGPQLMGFLFNWGLQGALTVQVYYYHLYSFKDSPILRCAVYAICMYEWLQTALLTADTFALIYNYGDPVNLIPTNYRFAWFSVYLMSAVESAAVQTYFAWRIYRLSRSRVLAGIIVLLATAQMTAGILGSVSLKMLHDSWSVPKVMWYDLSVLVWLAGSTMVDVMIATSMVAILRKSKTGYHRTDVLVDRLITMVVETGCLTASVAVLTLALFVGKKETDLSACPMLMIPKLYANTVLMSFNNRTFMSRSTDEYYFATSSRMRSTGSHPVVSTIAMCERSGSGAALHSPIVVTMLRERCTDALPEKEETHRSVNRPVDVHDFASYADIVPTLPS